MNLVDYSDSESSDSEEEKIGSPPPAPKPQHAILPTKRPVKKQIIVDLPKSSRADDDDDDEPLKKRARPNGQGGGGLFSILPPPKRSKPSTNGTPKAVDSQVSSVETSGQVVVEPVDTETPPPAKVVTTTSFMPRSTQAKKKVTQPKQPEPISKPTPPISLFPLGPDLISKPSQPKTSSTPSTYQPLITKPLPQEPFPTTTTTHPDPPFIPHTH